MKLTKRLVSLALLLASWLGSMAAVETNPQSVKDLLNRIGGNGAADLFETVVDPSLATNGKETFVLTSSGGKPCIKGSTLSALTTGIGWYLNHHASINLTWNCPKVDLLSANLPLPATETHTSDAAYRYYLNYTAFSYSMSTWTWDRWQEEIDWMALRGVNMPLQIIGLEEVWRRFLADYNYTQTEINNFVAGPCYMAWFGMNNLEGWGGPNPDWWYTRQGQLGKQICDRMRSLGIDPVLPGFYMLPTNFQSKTGFKTAPTGGWCQFTRSHLADPSAANYATVAANFYKHLHAVLGTSKYYSMDPFHEGGGSGNVSSIADVYSKAYEAMNTASPGSKWVIQSWQWSGAQRQSLNNVPVGKLIVLDLYSDGKPAWGNYGNHDVVYSTIFNFGGRSGYFGRAQAVIDGYWNAHTTKATVKGIGASPEAIEQTPVMYDLLYELPWYDGKPDAKQWFADYSKRRYGEANEKAEEAWEEIRTSALNMQGSDQGPQEAWVCARPNLDGNKVSTWGYNNLFYDPNMIIDAAYKLLDSGLTGENYSFDLTDMTRQAMTDYARKLIPALKEANANGDSENFAKRRDALLQLMLDIDELLNTNAEFMLGHWTQRARDMANEVSGTTTADRDWLELNNARQLISTWGAKAQAESGGLKDYSYRQWGGMMKDYYYQRWKVWFDNGMKAPAEGWFQWEWNWAHSNPGKYPTEPVGETHEVAERVLPKYLSAVNSNIEGMGTSYIPRLLSSDVTGKFFDAASRDAEYTPDLRIEGAEVSEIAIDFNKNKTFDASETVSGSTSFMIPADAPVGERNVRITLSDGTQFSYTLRIFEEITEARTVSVKTADAAQGSVSIDGTDAKSVNNTEIVVLRANPTVKYDFDYWADANGENVGNDNPMSYYGKEAAEFTAYFRPNIWGVPEFNGTNFPPADMTSYGQYLVSLGVTQGGESTTFFTSDTQPDEHFYYVTNRIKAAPGGAFHFDYKGKGDLRYQYLSAYCDLNADGTFDINSNELLGTKGTHKKQDASVGQGGFDVLLPYDTPKKTTHIRLRFDGAWMDEEVGGSWVNLTDHPNGVTGAFKPDAKTNRVIYEILLEINDGVEYNTTVTVKSNNETYGTVRSENMSNEYVPGEKVILTAFPQIGYRLSHWEDGYRRTLPAEWMNGTSIEFTAFDNADITAVFERIPVEIDLWQLELNTDENGLTYIEKVVTEGEPHLNLSDENTGYEGMIDYIAPGVFAGFPALKELTLPDNEMHMTAFDEFYNSGTLNGQANKIQIDLTKPNGTAATKENPFVRYEDPFRMTISGVYKGAAFNNTIGGCVLYANGDNGTGTSYSGGWSRILLREDGSVDVWWDSNTPVNFPVKITSDFTIKIDYLGNKQTKFTVTDSEGTTVEKTLGNDKLMQIWHYAVYIPAGMTEKITFSTPKTVAQIPGEALVGCRNLMDIHVPAGCTYAVEKNGVIYDKTGKNCIAYPEGRILGSAFSLVVPGTTTELSAAPLNTDGEMSNLTISNVAKTDNWNTLWTIDQDGSLIHYNSGLGVDNSGHALSKDDAVFSYQMSYDEGEPSISFRNEGGWYMTYQGYIGSPYSFDFYPVTELTVPAGNLRTVTFPVNVIVPNNADVYMLERATATGGYLRHIMPGHIIPAGTGVLVKGEADPFVITTLESAESPDELDGTTVELQLSTPYYILEGENFVRHESGRVPANRGYVPAGFHEMASFPYQVPGYEPVEIDGWKFDWRYSYDESVICLTAAVETGNPVLDLSKTTVGNDRIIDIDPAMFIGNTTLKEVTLPDSRLGQHYYNSSLQGAGEANHTLWLPQSLSGNSAWNMTLECTSNGNGFNQYGSGLFATGTNATVDGNPGYPGGFQLYLQVNSNKGGHIVCKYNGMNETTFDQVVINSKAGPADPTPFTIQFNYSKDAGNNYSMIITVSCNGKTQSKTLSFKHSEIQSFCASIPEGVNIDKLHLEGADFLFPYTEGDLFAGCTSLEALHVSENCDYAVEKDGALYDKQNPQKCIAYPEGRLYTRPFMMTCADNVSICADPIIDLDGLSSTEVTVQATDNPISALWTLSPLDNCLNHLNSGIHLNANGSGVGENHNEYVCRLVYGDEEPQLSFSLDAERYLAHTEGVLLIDSEPHLFRFYPVESFTAPVEEDMPHAVSFPLDVVVPQGANVKGISAIDGTFGATLFDIPAGTVVTAGQPIVTVGGASEFAFAPATEAQAAAAGQTANLLLGNVVAKNSTTPYYLLEGDMFVRHETGVIPSNSCYLPATAGLTTESFPFEDISDTFRILFNRTPVIVIEGTTDVLAARVENAPSYAVITFTSEDESIATIDADGVITGVAPGQTNIIATCGKASTSCPVFVEPAPDFYVTPQSSVLRVGETVQLNAMGEDAVGQTVTWKSSNEKVATVDASGLVTSVAVGETTIIAACAGVQYAVTITVNPPLNPSVAITTASFELNVGSTRTVNVTLTDMGKDAVVSWSSSDESVATVDSNGKVTAVAEGTATITATCNGIDDSITVTVNRVFNPTITLAPTTVELFAGETAEFVPTLVDMPEGATISWSSSNLRVATVANGVVTAVAEGTATITAVCNGKSARATVIVKRQLVPAIELDKSAVELTAGESDDLTATLTDMGKDAVVVWSSSDAAVATVDSNGHITAVAEGTATITATCNGLTATCTVIVNRRLVPAIELDRTAVELTEGESVTVNATLTDMPADATVEWLSTDTSVATVAGGVITAVAPGETTVVATCNGLEASVTVKVNLQLVPAISLTPDAVELVEGDELRMEVTLDDMPEDAVVVWSSSDALVATVSETGLVTAVAVGKATITATCNGLTAECLVTVNAKTGIDPNPGDDDSINGVRADDNDEYYSISGLRLNKSAKGYHIHNGKKVFKKG